MYLVSCEYFSDAERKRIEYAFNKYESEAKEMDKITGASRIVCDEDVEKLLSELYLRTSSKNIKLFKLSPLDLMDVPKSQSLVFQFAGGKETVESFVGYLLAQRKAVYKNTLNENVKTYQSITRKGYADIKVGIHENEGEVEVQIEINAEEPNLSYLLEYFRKELELFKTTLKD